MILVAGDAMIDRYLFGTVTRVSPEAPVPILLVDRQEDRDGGALNVARNAEAMGAKVRMLFSEDCAPIVKQRLVARTQQIARADWDPPQPPISYAKIDSEAQGCSVALLSDYGKGALSNCRGAIITCKAVGLKVFVDPKSNDPVNYENADVLKPNHYEMEAIVGKWHDEQDLAARAHRLRVMHNIGAILMTRGERGMTLFTDLGPNNVPGLHLELTDVSGAGDVALAALGVATDRGFGLLEAARFANKAAGISVSRFGTTVVSEAEVFG